MNNRIVWRLAGLIVFLASIKRYFYGWDYKWGVSITPAASIFLSFLGILLFIGSFFIKIPKHNKKMICEKCGSEYRAEHIQINICPECNGKLKPL